MTLRFLREKKNLVTSTKPGLRVMIGCVLDGAAVFLEQNCDSSENQLKVV